MSILGHGYNAIQLNTKIKRIENTETNFTQNICLNKIAIGDYQPRKTNISLESIRDLMLSIQEHGVLQPIILRESEFDKYELIAGERRYRAALELKLSTIPCIVMKVDSKEAFAIALIENIQREQLSLYEEAEALLKLKEEYSMSIDEVAKMINRPRPTVSNLIRTAAMLSYNGKILWKEGSVDYGHIRPVIVLDHEHQNIVLRHIVDKKLSVRQTETFIKEKKYLNLPGSQIKKSISDHKSARVVFSKNIFIEINNDSLIVTARKINQEDINNLQKEFSAIIEQYFNTQKHQND